MQKPWTTWAVAMALGSLSILAAHHAGAATLVGLTGSGKLVTFDSAAPGVVLSTATVSGLGAGESLLGIDYRPATGQLYGATASKLYVLNPATGAAAVVGTGFGAASGDSIGFDFNPAVDRIRLVGSTGQNLRLHPDTGALAATDTSLAYASADPNTGKTPSVTGAAYTNSYAGTTSTTLFAIDSGLDVLVTQGGPNQSPSPNGGLLFTVGALGVDTNGLVGFDITPTGTAYASLTQGTVSSLYAIGLGNGKATLVGAIGGGEPLVDLAYALPAGGGNISLLPSAAHATGFGGVVYTTDLTVANTTTSDLAFTMRFLGHDADGRTGSVKTMGVGAGKTVTYTDVLGSVFGMSTGYGAIRIVADGAGLVVMGQTSTPGAGGTVGQSVPAFRSTDLVRQGSPQVITPVQNDAAFRTNLILANANESALDVDVSLVSDAGKLLGARTYSLPPLGMTQVTGVVKDLGVSETVSSGRLVVSTPTANGAFAAYGALIDNPTGDPRTVLAREAARSLFERLGGKAAIGAVIDEFLGFVVPDERINAFFAATVANPARVANLRQRLIEIVAEASGGPLKYGGVDMKTAHRGMGIGTPEFNALVEDLVKAMVKLNVPEKERSEVVGLLAPLKGDIVEKP